MKISFSVYGFFGYLAAGFLLLAATDYAFDGDWLLSPTIATAPSTTLHPTVKSERPSAFDLADCILAFLVRQLVKRPIQFCDAF